MDEREDLIIVEEDIVPAGGAEDMEDGPCDPPAVGGAPPSESASEGTAKKGGMGKIFVFGILLVLVVLVIVLLMAGNGGQQSFAGKKSLAAPAPSAAR